MQNWKIKNICQQKNKKQCLFIYVFIEHAIKIKSISIRSINPLVLK